MNKTKYFKYTIRFAKEYGVLQELKKAVGKFKKHTCEHFCEHYPTDNEILLMFENEFRNKGEKITGRFFNDYTMSIHKAIGEDKSFEIFEKYIITEYGQPILDRIIDNMSINYMKIYSDTFIEKYLKEEFENLNDKIYEKLTKKEKINLFKQLPATGYMMSMFNWSSTTQGHEYWKYIYYKWIDYYMKLIMQ